MDESDMRRDAVTVLDGDIRTVSRRLDELAASTDDLRAETYDVGNVLEQRENYEVICGSDDGFGTLLVAPPPF